jgi:hypothetical protein
MALSSFSAGFAALKHILSEPAVPDRVDAVLLEDSLYAAYSDPEEKQLVPSNLKPFVSFARAAARGQKLMAMTHSEVPTQGYASTRETADLLLDELGLERHPASSGKGTVAEKGNFWLRGLPGIDKEAHARHLQTMASTTLPRLAHFW